MITLLHDLTDGVMKKPIVGCWKVWPDGAIVARLPCGHVQELEGHAIHEDGSVSPSVVCTHGDWHQEVRLEDWDTDFRMNWPQSVLDRDRQRFGRQGARYDLDNP